ARCYTSDSSVIISITTAVATGDRCDLLFLFAFGELNSSKEPKIREEAARVFESAVPAIPNKDEQRPRQGVAKTTSLMVTFGELSVEFEGSEKDDSETDDEDLGYYDNREDATPPTGVKTKKRENGVQSVGSKGPAIPLAQPQGPVKASTT
ncbi:hypothetical protein PC121_g23250, partial [Phytophthora cactorum]